MPIERTIAYTDGSGALHYTFREAQVAELARILRSERGTALQVMQNKAAVLAVLQAEPPVDDEPQLPI